jgi:hypothetical protein
VPSVLHALHPVVTRIDTSQRDSRFVHNDVTVVSGLCVCVRVCDRYVMILHSCLPIRHVRMRMHVQRARVCMGCQMGKPLSHFFFARVGVHGCYAQACKTQCKTLRMRRVSFADTPRMQNANVSLFCVSLSFFPADSCVRGKVLLETPSLVQLLDHKPSARRLLTRLHPAREYHPHLFLRTRASQHLPRTQPNSISHSPACVCAGGCYKRGVSTI